MRYSIKDLENFEALKAIIESTSTSAKSSQEILDALTKFGIEWHLSGEGMLWVKTWQTVADGFVSPEQSAIIRTTRQSPEQSVELDWLSKNLQSIRQDYAGQWIAICGNRIVSAATDLPNLMSQIAQFDKPFITFIPSDQIAWTLTYAN
ncbi:hypothetical protein ES703_45735 [subsurface metagenome]